MSAPAAIEQDVYSRAVGTSFFVDPSENESGVAFSVAMIYVLPIDSPVDVNVQHAAVKGTDSFGAELGFNRGYRGNGITFCIGGSPAGVRTISSNSCLIGCLNVGMTYSGIMLFPMEVSEGVAPRGKGSMPLTRLEALAQTPSPRPSDEGQSTDCRDSQDGSVSLVVGYQ